MILAGSPARLGAVPDKDGTGFAVYSSVAEKVDLCLFDESGNETGVHTLPECTEFVWHGYLPGCTPGQRYGYRVHGEFDPDRGMRCNAAKVLLDPYARQLDGDFTWHDSVFDSNALDSSAHVPLGVVTPDTADSPFDRPDIPWAETIFYELNVRGYTIRHPAIDNVDRGRFAGMRNRAVLDYLNSLGVSTIELMPVHAFIDELHLVRNGLRNFWGYNPISFFAPANRYARLDGIREFRDMVRAIHDAGIEVVLDVVYNHTGEGDTKGPTLGFRGLDNLAYYRTEPDDPGCYINDTGCGNTLNFDHPRVRDLVLESLRYWHRDMGVDGFRFDLAPVLGRHGRRFSRGHPMLEAIGEDPLLRDAKLVAEPWDPGPGGYQLGHFPERWAEWNDRYRDTVRRFWRGDPGMSGGLAASLRGSAEIFETGGRPPFASVNLVTSHDGFTLSDVVSYERRHNEANGEDNRDGHVHNFSCNHGVEGPTDDVAIATVRRTHRLNLLSTLLLSQGTPLLLAGDEFGNSQNGNNNAYAQDNETAWIDWSDLESDADFVDQVRRLIRLRREMGLLRIGHYLHGRQETDQGWLDIHWHRPDGQHMTEEHWPESAEFRTVIAEHGKGGLVSGISVAINGTTDESVFVLDPEERWQLEFGSADDIRINAASLHLPAFSLAVLTAP